MPSCTRLGHRNNYDIKRGNRSQCFEHDQPTKHRIAECERLKEIIPSVANKNRVNEVKIIKEAIKHIGRLERAVMERLLTTQCSPQTPEMLGLNKNDSEPILRTELLRSIVRQAAARPIAQEFQFHPVPRIPFSGSTGSTPNRTDDEDHLESDT